MMSSQANFPTIQFDGIEVTCYGVSPNRRHALIGRRVAMEERHLYGGTGGGRSKASLVDEKGQPKKILRMQLVSFCNIHRVAWEGEAGCPECARQDGEYAAAK